MMTDTTNREDTAARMRELALRVALDLEAESAFDVDDVLGNVEDFETPIRAQVPDSIWEYVDATALGEDPETTLETALDDWRNDALGEVLDVSGAVSFDHDGGLTLDTLTVVLGTGGPHVEVTFDDSGRGHVRAYDWFREGLTDIPVSFAGHPIAEMFELYAARVEGRL